MSWRAWISRRTHTHIARRKYPRGICARTCLIMHARMGPCLFWDRSENGEHAKLSRIKRGMIKLLKININRLGCELANTSLQIYMRSISHVSSVLSFSVVCHCMRDVFFCLFLKDSCFMNRASMKHLVLWSYSTLRIRTSCRGDNVDLST